MPQVDVQFVLYLCIVPRRWEEMSVGLEQVSLFDQLCDIG